MENNSQVIPWRLGVDIGGTFTDVALEGLGQRFITKVLTTSGAPEEGVLTAIRQALAAAHLAPAGLSVIIHGTTLATNALIERKGARTALITTQGFRDVLHLGTESRFEQYDLYLEKPEPLVPRRLRFAVPERVNAQGEVLTPLDEAAVTALIPALAEQAIESVAVAFLHSFANPAHEQRVRELLAAALPELSISLSCEVSPEIREYERFSTTCANAYVQPKVAGYLQNLEVLLRENGFICPVFAFLSNGGLADLETASRFPVRLIESGPAGGAILASHIARQCGLESVVSYDMGGTTAKLCLLEGARPRTAREFEVARMYRFKRGSGLPVRIPVIEMVEIGAGGGSLCQVNPLGLISVGPDSAGSEPGPACYGRGGSRATITDANLLLGRIDPAAFAGGTLPLDVAAAEAAVDRDVARPLALPRPLAAQGVVEVVDEDMANAAREHAAEQGQSLAGRTLIAFGGSAPLHAARLAQKLGLRRIVIPSGAGVGSAIGFLRAPVAFELVRSRYQRLGSLNIVLINSMLDEMTAEARAFVSRGAPEQEVQVKRLAYMRYVGQRHEISVPLPSGPLQPGDAEKLRAAYDAAYLEQFGRTIPKLEIEVMSWSVAVSTLPPEVERLSGIEQVHEVRAGETKLLFDFERGEVVEAGLYRRSDLPPGAVLSGPALIVEAETTTVVPPGWRASVNGLGYIVLEVTALTSSKIMPTTGQTSLNEIRLQVMWTRLIGVVEEQAKSLMRTAFSEVVSEAGDLSAGVFDPQGRMVAQAITGTPGHVNSMAEAVKHFVTRFPVETMRPGDHFITNDPWIASGHLHDITVVSPAFYRGRLVALFACTCHQVDIGGRGQGPDGRSVFEEGLFIPMMALARAGQINEDLLEIIRANVRQPYAVEGDILSYITSNEVGARSLAAMLDQFPEISFAMLADFIMTRSQAAMIEAIRKLRPGTYRHTLTLDGYDAPVELAATLTIEDERILVDYPGSSPASPYGINLVLNYTKAYTAFGVRAAVCPYVPNNSGSLAPIVGTAPEGSILNVQRPAPVAARHIIGLFLPDLVLGCLAQVMPGRIPAESSSVWGIQLRGGPEAAGTFGWDKEQARPFEILLFNSAGAGARPGKDGLSATAFPSGIKSLPVEIAENAAPIMIWQKELHPDSGGPGERRGGLGQTVEVSTANGAPFAVFAMWDRTRNPARGRAGGRPGSTFRAGLSNGEPIHSKGKQFIAPGARLRVELPGGGGFGDPLARDVKQVAFDVAEGLVSREAAQTEYGVVFDINGSIDEAATEAERKLRLSER